MHAYIHTYIQKSIHTLHTYSHAYIHTHVHTYTDRKEQLYLVKHNAKLNGLRTQESNTHTNEASVMPLKPSAHNLNETDTPNVEFYIRALPWGDMSAVEDVLRLSHDGVSGMHRVHADFVVGADIVYGRAGCTV
jgi:hypothetical protein